MPRSCVSGSPAAGTTITVGFDAPLTGYESAVGLALEYPACLGED
jgi:hypothetical protein